MYTLCAVVLAVRLAVSIEAGLAWSRARGPVPGLAGGSNGRGFRAAVKWSSKLYHRACATLKIQIHSFN